jgi:hypothetical protein
VSSWLHCEIVEAVQLLNATDGWLVGECVPTEPVQEEGGVYQAISILNCT